MDEVPENGVKVPEGLDFLSLVLEREDLCEEHTRNALPGMGEKVPKCLEEFGTVLSLLDRAASCFWVCRGGDHVLEYLAGRVASSSRASLRLLYLGFYDESLSLTRGIGETANLLFLFMEDADELNDWLKSDKERRKRHFKPADVRKRLADKGIPLPMDNERYQRLCEIATHVTPQTKPQSHSPIGIPTLGGYFQEGGVITALNELAAATSLATVPIPRLLAFDLEKRKTFHDAALRLLGAVGAIDVLTADEIWSKIRVSRRTS